MDLPKHLKDLQSLLDLMRRNELAELEIEEEGHRIRLRKSEPRIAAAPISYAGEAPVLAPVPQEGRAEEAAEEVDESLQVVKAPLVGTFYRAPSPEADPFVEEGDRVEADTVLCIIEAMKVMNDIPAGVTGVIREVLVQNGEPVEFGQPLFRVEAS